MSEVLLTTTLEAVVPLWIDKLKGSTFEERAERAHRCADVVGAHGDLILYKVEVKKGKGKAKKTATPKMTTAAAFNALAEGIACCAFQPGGITILGLHFEATP